MIKYKYRHLLILKGKAMKESIIFAPGLNHLEMVRSLARLGKNTIGTRIMGAAELAKHALMISGISVTEKFLTPGEEPALIYTCMKDAPYFGSASFADAENFAAALNTLRMLIASPGEEAVLKENLKKGEFPDKNEAIIHIYEKYSARLKEDNLTDTIGLIRKAIGEAAPLDIEISTLTEYPLTPLEMTLLAHLSAGKYTASNVAELLGKKEAKIHIGTYVKGYGSINEALYILSDIYEKNLPLDKCVIALANPVYSQVFFDLGRQYDIPMTFGSGVPITNTNPAALLKLLLHWDTYGGHGIDALKNLFASDAINHRLLLEDLWLQDNIALNDLIEKAGNLRLSFDKERNADLIAAYKAPPWREKKKSAEDEEATKALLQRLSGILSMGYSAFLSRYAIIRKMPLGRFDRSALEVITKFIDSYLSYAGSDSLNNVLPRLLEKTVSSELCSEGHLHITSISGAAASLKENVYVVGLSASEFPGMPRENYLLLDSDLLLFAGDDIAPTSARRIARKKEEYLRLLSLASLAGSRITLSYAGYDIAQLKEKNPSSVLFFTFEEENPGKSIEDFMKQIKNAPYFADGILSTRLIGKEYTAKKEYTPESAPLSPLPEAEGLIDRGWSPSALELFFSCPRHFYYRYIAKISDEQEDDPNQVISAADFGTLAHEMMERLANSGMGEEDFLSLCESAFKDFLRTRPPVQDSDASKVRLDFLSTMKTAYETDADNQVLSAEKEYEFTHPSGVKLHGYPDRVEKTKDGKHLIADFKTKRSIEHIENDPASCLQVILYSWLCEMAGIPIDYGEYRYIRKGKTISCKYDEAAKETLNSLLLEFKNALLTNSFPPNPGEKEKKCKYCGMNSFCMEELKEEKKKEPKEEKGKEPAHE